MPLAFIQTSEITLTGTFRYANTYPTAIDLAATGKVDLDAMVTSHYGLAETEEALQASGKDPANVKPMVIPNGSRKGFRLQASGKLRERHSAGTTVRRPRACVTTADAVRAPT